MKRFLSALLLAAGFSSLLAADSLKAKQPANHAVLSAQSTLQHLVMTVSLKEQEALWNDRIFMQRISACPKASLPQGVEFRWEYEGALKAPLFRLRIAGDAAMTDAKEFYSQERQFLDYGLLPGKTYYWCVEALDAEKKMTAASKICTFSLDGTLPRVLAMKGATNARDLGGMPAQDGRKIPYGLLIRSSEITGKNLPNDLGIKTELDLRWKSETNGQNASVWGEDVQYANLSATLYGAMFTSQGMANCAELFRFFTRPENYPIDFHCVVGADRTGTLAFLLEAVLGCPEEAIRRDYVFSSFASPRYFSAVDALIEGMAAYASQEGEPLQWCAERYLLRAGVAASEIRAFQEFILGGDLQPSPVLEAWLRIEALKTQFEKTAEFAFVESSPVKGTMLQCGKEFAFNPVGWGCNPIQFVGAGREGGFLVQYRNTKDDVLFGAFSGAGLAAEEYVLLDPIAKYAYRTPEGKTSWTSAELADVAFPLAAHSEGLLMLAPAGKTPLDEYAIREVKADGISFLMASSEKAAPVIDGKMDDEMWTSQKPYPLCATDGTPVKTGLSWLYLGTDSAHEILYVAVRVEDETYAAQVREHDRDCWADDEVELFISAVGDSTYYQIITNRAGSTFDGKGQNSGWNLTSFSLKTGEVEGGWFMEAAIPLEQLQLPNAIELNVCTTDIPRSVQRNLGATGGIYHTREALKPILLK